MFYTRYAVALTLFLGSCIKKNNDGLEINQPRYKPVHNEKLMQKMPPQDSSGYQPVEENFSETYKNTQNYENEYTPAQNTQPQNDFVFNKPARSSQVPVIQNTQGTYPSVNSMNTSYNSNNEGVYEIQAGSYKNSQSAQSIAQKLSQGNVGNVRIDTREDGTNVIRITKNTPLQTREEASQFLQEIISKTQHYDIMVVKK